MIRCRNKERSFDKDNYKKGLQRISISLNCMSFSRDRYIRVVSYDPPQILHRYWGIYRSLGPSDVLGTVAPIPPAHNNLRSSGQSFDLHLAVLPLDSTHPLRRSVHLRTSSHSVLLTSRSFYLPIAFLCLLVIS